MVKFNKTIYILIVAIFSVSLFSCRHYLDVNTNPNSATSATPDLVLPAAIATTASNLTTFNDYGAWAVGYQVNAGGYGGWGTVLTYNYTSSDNTGLWSYVWLNLKDYQYVITSTQSNSKYVLFNAVAKILKVYNYQLLVDEYGNVPYSQGLLGSDNATPVYDSASSVYKNLVLLLDSASETLHANISNSDVSALSSSSDPLFSGNITKWIQFANSLKLQLLIRGASSSSFTSFVKAEIGNFSSEGFLGDDAIVNPGYSASSNENPYFATFHSSISGTYTGTSESRIPATFAFSFYDGTKLTDTKRGKLTYYNFPNTNKGQLGNTTTNPFWMTSHPAWYIGHGTGTNSADTVGILKGRDAGVPIFLASQTYFLLAEAALNGYAISGDAKTNFDKGIVASFTYLEKNASNSVPSGVDPSAEAVAYQQANATSYLANYDKASSNAERLEAIITQKYIALNFILSHEAWNEFRRTTYPAIVNGSSVATLSFASISSASSRSDKLPVRNIYPQNEYNLNSNTPTLTSAFANPIFWDVN